MNLIQKTVSAFRVGNMLPAGFEHGELPRSRDMYSRYIRMAIPSVLEMVLISLINMVDTMMVSTIGTDAVAAVGLVAQPRFIVLCFFWALNTGITAVVARRKGENRQEDANKVLRNSLIIGLLLSFVLMAVFIPFSGSVLRFAGAIPGETLEDAVDYFNIVNAVLPFQVLSMAICAAQRGIGNTKLTMYVNIASNLVNILMNYLLINGIGPFPKLGVRGAAIATAIGLVVGFILTLFSLSGIRRGDRFLRLNRGDSWKPDKEAIGDVVRVASGSLLEQLVLRIGFFTYSKIVADLGTDSFAAHQIASQFLGLSFSFADGLSIAATSLVGQSLGQKRKDKAFIYGQLAQRFGFILSIGLAAVCIFFRSWLVGLYIDPENASPAVRPMAENVMYIVGAFQLFQLIAVTAAGALRGAGDVKYTAKVMLITVMFVRPIFSLAAVWILKPIASQGTVLLGIWIASISDIILRMILMMRRYNAAKWTEIRV